MPRAIEMHAHEETLPMFATAATYPGLEARP